jgi:hypothetical protein
MWVQLDQLARPVYAGLRAGHVAPEAAFDLAVFVMDRGHSDPVLAELAELDVDGQQEQRLAELAGRVLAVSGWEPGFADEPDWLEAITQALASVEADLRATGLEGPVRLVLIDGEPGRAHAFVEFRGGYGSTGGIPPAAGGDPVSALVAVADELQDAVVHDLMTAWPLCPVHKLGAHPVEHAGVAVWRCSGSGGHVIAAIGAWPK